MKMLKKGDIKPWYLLEVEKQGNHYFAVVTYGSDGDLCYSSEKAWAPINTLDTDLKNVSSRVNKIYGYAPNAYAYDLSTFKRPLLWERSYGVKNISVAEAEKLLKEKFSDYDEVNIVIKW